MKKARAREPLEDSIKLMIRANRLRERTVDALAADEVELWNMRFATIIAWINTALINGIAAEHPGLEPTEEDFKKIGRTVREPRKRRR